MLVTRPTIVIGDIHGKIDLMIDILTTFPDHNRVWVGDFVDSFDRTVEDQIKCLRNALALVQDGGLDTVLFGNHEMSYLYPMEMRCSGYNAAMQAHVDPIAYETRKHFRFFHSLEFENDAMPVIITHAGVSKLWWNDEHPILEPTPDNIINSLSIMTDAFNPKDWDDPLTRIGFARGGRRGCGGPLWCDWNDEFFPIDGIGQVVGHTRRSDIGYVTTDVNGSITFGDNRSGGYGICVDCLESDCRNVVEFDTDGTYRIREF